MGFRADLSIGRDPFLAGLREDPGYADNNKK
jgi:hypothetical protein